MFFKKVNQIIFTEHEICSPQLLLGEYRQIGGECIFDVVKLKYSYLKKALIKEFGDDIGFHVKTREKQE